MVDRISAPRYEGALPGQFRHLPTGICATEASLLSKKYISQYVATKWVLSHYLATYYDLTK
ncbi:MAG: hypothetical protein WCZ87_09865 [Thiohalobacteraceae bacterium]